MFKCLNTNVFVLFKANDELFEFIASAYSVEFRVKDPKKYELLNVSCKSLQREENLSNSW